MHATTQLCKWVLRSWKGRNQTPALACWWGQVSVIISPVLMARAHTHSLQSHITHACYIITAFMQLSRLQDALFSATAQSMNTSLQVKVTYPCPVRRWKAKCPRLGRLRESLVRFGLKSYLPSKTLSMLPRQQPEDYGTVPFSCQRGLEHIQHGPFFLCVCVPQMTRLPCTALLLQALQRRWGQLRLKLQMASKVSATWTSCQKFGHFTN